MIELRPRSVDNFSRAIYVDNQYVGVALFCNPKDGPRIEWEENLPPNVEASKSLILHTVLNYKLPRT